MAKIPSKLCSCGLHNDISAAACVCGKPLAKIPALLVDAPIPVQKRGNFREALPVFVQKCSVCGALNFTHAPSARVTECYNCHKTRIRRVDPVAYEEPETGEAAPEEAPADAPSAGSSDADRWSPVLKRAVEAAGGQQEEEEEISWGDVLEEEKPQKSGTITFTATCYGNLVFTLTPDRQDLPLLLGRYASYWEFLEQDGRVSNEHCYITCENGKWKVTDNHARNGTLVNGVYIGRDGSAYLNDGDVLTLGHHPDSMAFRITLG